MLKKKKKKMTTVKTGFDPRDIGLDSDSFVDASDVDLEGGFQPLIVNVESEQKIGKTHWCLDDVPEPIVVFNHDNGLRGVIEQFLAQGKKIIVAGDPSLIRVVKGRKRNFPHYQVVNPKVLLEIMSGKNESVLDRMREEAYPTWCRWVDDYYQFLEASGPRSGIVDTGGAAFQLGKLAFHGMARGVTQKDDPYGAKGGELKSIFRGLVSHGLNYDKIVCWTHRLKQEWKGGENTGNMTHDGYDQLPYECDFTIRITRRTKGGETTRHGVILDSRRNGSVMNGQKFGGEGQPEMTFKSVAAFVTMTDDETWETQEAE